MRNLLRAGLYRLSKDILFWIAVGVSLLVGIIFGLSYRSQSIFDDFSLCQCSYHWGCLFLFP